MSNFVCIILYYLFKGRPKLYKLHAAQKSVSCPTWPCFCISVIEPAYYHFCCWKRKWIEGPGISLVPTREGQETLCAIFLEQKRIFPEKFLGFLVSQMWFKKCCIWSQSICTIFDLPVISCGTSRKSFYFDECQWSLSQTLLLIIAHFTKISLGLNEIIYAKYIDMSKIVLV